MISRWAGHRKVLCPVVFLGGAGVAERVAEGCPEGVASGAIRSTPWGDSLHPPASPGANRSSVWANFPDWCSNFPIGAFGGLARDLHMSWGMSRAARSVATSHKGHEGDR